MSFSSEVKQELAALTADKAIRENRILTVD